MARSGFLSYVDDKLEQLFNKKPRDPSKDRAKMLAHLDKCDEQFRNPPEKGRKFVTVRGDVVKFAPRYPFHGKDAHFMSRDSYPAASKTLRSEIIGGQHDALAVSDTGKRSSGGGKGWTEERRKRYQQTMAAKKGK